MDKKYRIGIDVGLNSVGFAAIEVDGQGKPLSILNSVVYVHDGGVDPTEVRGARRSRRAIAGHARRVRRQIRNRKARLEALDRFLVENGYPIVSHEDLVDSYEPWLTRKQLVEEKLEGAEQKEAISIALRHIARHRGWRNPWQRFELLYEDVPNSDLLEAFRSRVQKACGGESISEDLTPAQLVCELFKDESMRNDVRIRGEVIQPSVIGSVEMHRIHQSDFANEIRRIGRIQGMSDDTVKSFIDYVFYAEKPGKHITERVGRCALQPDQPRAGRWTIAFQKFKIVSVVANLRIKNGGQERVLTSEERLQIFDFLMSVDEVDKVTWSDIAEEVLKIPRRNLVGTAKASMEGERPSGNPPFNVTDARIQSSKSQVLKTWWSSADDDAREALLQLINNAGELTEDWPGFDAVKEFVMNPSDDVLEAFDKLSGKENSLPKGRAAYSIDTLNRLTNYMLENSVDLHEARKAVFNLQDDWAPPVDDIGSPVGHPTVDRVLKIVNRYLRAITERYGVPERVTIEHARDAFTSEEARKEKDDEANRRARVRRAKVDDWKQKYGVAGDTRRSDIRKIEALERQRNECLYCGRKGITFGDCEIDHILPQSGSGSDNRTTNLAATCGPCNTSKRGQLFLEWAPTKSVNPEDVYERVKYWDVDLPTKTAQQSFKKEVLRRLRATELGEFDNRSIESVAWMANLLRARIEGYYQDSSTSDGGRVQVGVFPGAITATARKASGFEGRVQLIGGNGKTRFDRRHHAMDAVVIAMMSPSVAKSLKIREEMREAEHLQGSDRRAYREFRGETEGDRVLYRRWQAAMDDLVGLFNEQLEGDVVPVIKPLRLRLADSAIHGETIYTFNDFKKGKKKKVNPVVKIVGDAWTRDELDHVETAKVRTALSRLPDFNRDARGEEPVLTEDSSRRISLNGKLLEANDKVQLLSEGTHGWRKQLSEPWTIKEIDQVETPQLWCALTQSPDFDSKKGLPADGNRQLQVNGVALAADTKVGLFGEGRAGIKRRDGWAVPKIHHARIYRIDGGKKPKYAMLRVFSCDLLRHRRENLFAVELPPQSISMRTAAPTLKKAIQGGKAVCLGWFVKGDEFSIDNLAQGDRGVDALMDEFPAAQGTTWRVRGFENARTINLEPVLLAGEGVKYVDISKEAEKILTGNFYRASVDKLFSSGRVTLIRRNALGQERWRSTNGLPTSMCFV